MSDLAFIDASSIRMIVNLARSLGLPRQLILQCQPDFASRFGLFGTADLRNVRLVDAYDR